MAVHPLSVPARAAAALCLLAAATAQEPTVHHDLRVSLEPARHRIAVEDVVELPAALLPREGGGIRFRLHAGLELGPVGEGFTAQPVRGAAADAHVGINAAFGDGIARTWELRPAGGAWPEPARVRLSYSGAIHHELQTEEQEYARSFSRTPGIIDEVGVVLSGSSFWLPAFGDALVRFRLAVDLPAGWDAVSQGARTGHEVTGDRRRVTWDCRHPMDEAYLIAARFVESSRPVGNATAFAFLREPDPGLAARYLEATAQYLEMYRRLIGPYPYEKFALVENFWETGYGMPSFTLLGPKIIRFPFILHSSYPHEILHNWWGNSVFVDYARGNWCEGLTAYLADHLIKEGQGRGAEYRRDALKRYRNYVRTGDDFPLTSFRTRHSSSSEAVGYGKALMLFHMLRLELGDAAFVRGLQAFYREFAFRRASFDDIAAVFSRVGERELAPFFAQWVERTGAPELALAAVAAREQGGGAVVDLTVRQLQEAAPYALRVPVAFHVEGRAEPLVETLELAGREHRGSFTLPARPRAVQLDPAFDVFRRLHRAEIPPTIGQLFGAARVLLVLPADDPLGDAWQEVARAWTGSEGADVQVSREDRIDALPADRAVWVLGAGNRWAATVREAVAPFDAGLREQWIDFGDAVVERARHCFVLVGAHPADPDGAVGWIGADLAEALPGLARKLPHYGKYSYLAFSGTEPTNDAKGSWPAVGSPLVHRFGDAPLPAAELAAREPLARLAPVFDAERMLGHVRVLASDELEGRGVGTAGLERAAGYIAAAFEAAGLEPGGDDGTFFQSWQEPGGPDGGPVRLSNVIGVLPGTRPEWREQSVVVGAHHDHLGRGWPDARQGMAGRIHNGADDNASGVAVLLEVAQLLGRELQPQRSIVFVAFSGEEWGLRGSRHYVRAMRRFPVSRALAMVNLDTVGRLQGRKLTVLGTGTASEWVHIAIGIGFTTGVESTAVADDPGGSDQKSFHEAGVPAVQLFSGAHEDYHRPSDDVEKIDAEGLVRVATFVREALVYLADRDRPLTSQLGGGETARPAAEARGGRRVSLGTMPDFAFAGPGVRVARVMPDSPASAAGIEGGDVLLAIDGEEVADLRAYAAQLARRTPGDEIEVRVRRGGEELVLRATLAAR